MGTTMYHQVIDAAEEWLDVNGPRNKVKLISSQSRILCTRLAKSAWYRTLKVLISKRRSVKLVTRGDTIHYFTQVLLQVFLDPSWLDNADETANKE